MKKLLIFVSIFMFSVPITAYATDGNAYSSSTVQNSISGSGSVTTHIESTVNGQTKTLDANTPGTYSLQNSSGESSIKPTPIKRNKIHKIVQTQNFLQSLQNFLKDLFKKI